MKFSEGDSVLAKKPSSQEFTKATIVSSRGSKYKVQFKGGVEHTVDEADVKAERTSRSQTRTRGRPTKSPSKRSPSRRSPARKSPARSPNAQARKLPLRSTKQAKVSIPRLEIPIDNLSDTDKTEGSESLSSEYTGSIQKSRLKDVAPVTRRRSIRIMSSVSKAEQERKLALLRQADNRSPSLPVDRKAQYDSKRGFSLQPDEDLLKYYEDDADTESEGRQKDIEHISKPQEWGGWPGALILTFFLPTFMVLLQLTCTFNHCSFKAIYDIKKHDWKSFINPKAYLLYGGYLCFVAIISALPIGRLVDGQQSKTGRLQYRINGIWILILSVAAFVGGVYKGYNIVNFLLEKSLPLTIAGLSYGILLAIFLFIKGGRVPVSHLNTYGSTHNIIYDFWQGREVNPRIRSLDIKLALFRATMILIIIINLAAIFKIVGPDPLKLDWRNANIAGLCVASLQIFYALDILILEASWITSFEIMYEGTGFMLSVGYFTYPFLATLTTRYVIHHKNNPPIYGLILLVITFFIGYAIYRISNSQKDNYRKNPFAPSVSHLETIPTKRGTRLIVSGLWGFVRHPNYLGDIIMHVSLSCLSWTYSDILPHILAIFTTAFLIHRAVRDNARCAKRYGYAWDQYCSRVKYSILKKVF